MTFEHWLAAMKEQPFDFSIPEPNTGCWLWLGRADSCGYSSVDVRRNGKKTTTSAHRIVYAAHFGPIPQRACVCHRCDVRLCVNPTHLFLGTHADNMADKVAKGRQARGPGGVPPANSNTKRLRLLTTAEVLAVRASVANGERYADLARRFDVSLGTIGLIARRVTWKHI
jgi:hypothetical protein